MAIDLRKFKKVHESMNTLANILAVAFTKNLADPVMDVHTDGKDGRIKKYRNKNNRDNRQDASLHNFS